jgi:hypothetical protein
VIDVVVRGDEVINLRHTGGMQELAKRIPIAHYLDHGPSVEPREQTPGFSAAYAEALFVSPSRETLLIDSGNPGGRDTDRIVAMLNDGGFKPRRNTPLSNRAIAFRSRGLTSRYGWPGPVLRRARVRAGGSHQA